MRCPACGEQQSKWAARCERCGADLADAPLEPEPRPRRPVESSVDTRRRARKVLTAAVAFAVAIVGVAGGVLVTRRHRSPLEVAPSSTTAPAPPVRAPITVIEVARTGDLVARDLSDGSNRVLATNAAGWPQGPAVVAGHVLYVSGSRVLDANGMRPLVPGDVVVPVPGRPQFWTALRAGAAPKAQLWSVTNENARLEATLTLRGGELPVLATPQALVVDGESGAVVRRVPSGQFVVGLPAVRSGAEVLGSLGNEISYVESQCPVRQEACPLVLVDTTTGVVNRSVPPPAGARTFMSGGDVAPGGRIAAFVAAAATDAGSRARLVIIDPGSGEPRPVGPPFAIGEEVGAAAWDPSGRWLVFGGPRETYLLDTTTGDVTRLPFAAGYGFVVTDDARP